MIFFLFQPREQTNKEFAEIPTLELKNFKLSELDRFGLTSTMYGEIGIKFTNRYIVENLNYTDNSSEYISNIKSNNALYKDFVLNLDGNIKYFREDGLSFTTQKASYNKQTNIMISYTNYISQMNGHRALGSYLEYDNNLGTTKSKNVTFTYQLKESKE